MKRNSLAVLVLSLTPLVLVTIGFLVAVLSKSLPVNVPTHSNKEN
jgi:hypothetical protein